MMTPIRWRRWLLVSTLVSLAACLAVTADESRFRIIDSESPESLQRKLNAMASSGYRAIFAGRGSSLSGKGRTVVLLERNKNSSDHHEYRVLELSGRIDTFGQVSELGKAGFRMTPGMMLPQLPDDWWTSQSDYDDDVQLILERSDTSAAYAYDVYAYATLPTFDRDVTELMKRGYDVLGVLNSARRLRIVFERDLHVDPVGSQASAQASERYRIIIGSNKLGLRHQLNDASAEGYRVVGVAETGTHAPPMMLMEQVANADPGLEYKFLYEPGKVILRIDIQLTLEEKLNKRARNGFRITTGAVSHTVVVMERSEHEPAVQYRTLSSRTSPGLAENLQRLAEQGFQPITMFVSGDETTVVVEKPES